LETGNSNYSGRYVFAGYNTGDAPFESVSTAVGEKIMYNGKYLSLGGPISSSVSDEDYKAFYLDNMDKISGQPEMQSAVINTFTATAPALDFSLSLDGVSQSISLTDGTTYDADTLQIELQSKINAAFPSGTGQPGPLIKVSTQDDKLKLTVQDGSSIQIDSGTLNVKTIGFTGGTESIANAKQEIEYKMGVGNLITINVEGNEMFGKGEESLFNTLTKLEMALEGETSYKTATYDEGPPAEVIVETHELDISSLLGDLDLDLSRILKSRSVLGAKTNYVELTQNRLSSNNVTFTELLSNTEDADYAEVSMKLASAETVYSAALSASAKVIQPSLLDFLT
jgi:flagellar hook-associated protein 3 FlgL